MAAFGALLNPATDMASVGAAGIDTGIPADDGGLQDNVRRRLHGLGRILSSLAHPASTLRRRRATCPASREFFAERVGPRTA